ncbi:MAG: [FeFe] hydrogenase H-cluster maturation GTPase HydF [Clostridiales bacterium]|jgi:[FeFe] hydrogenase H-cluster maturation GTPase HydF|nr:[FeFe] hydrogenase H-cluster maturation GTPase HydF [Clostridiales bacterium]
MELQQTPGANRLHIGIFGRRNSGKSSLINAITQQEIALVSQVAGTTTDPVYKAMEIPGIGPCMLIDTAGFDDEGDLGAMRVEKTRAALAKTDVAILVFSQLDLSREAEWVAALRQKKTPILAVISQRDVRTEAEIVALQQAVREHFSLEPLLVSAKEGAGISQIKDEILRAMPEDFEMASITGHLVSPHDVVLLVMPQDIQAPKGRLILPQVQTIRDLLDHQCVVMSATADQLETALAALEKPPSLIITDSQVFPFVFERKPEESRLTSFSILLAAYKGDLSAFVTGAKAIDTLTEQSRVLIAEACTHAPLSEDIGRVKIPAMLRKRFGSGLQVDLVSGADFPQDVSSYDLIIHCGACMFNRKHVLSRVEQAKQQGTPICNYGVVIAKLTGILDHVFLG